MREKIIHIDSIADEQEIIQGLRYGGEWAVRKLYTMYYRGLCYFADTVISNRQEAQDIATETFLKLLKKKADFDSMSAVRGFLFVATKNACIDYLRKTKRHDVAHRQLALAACPVEYVFENDMIEAKVLQAIYASMEKLPLQCRKVFESIFIEGKTTAVIAAEMGISPQTVLNQKSKAIRILREALLLDGIYPDSVIALMFAFFVFQSR